MLEKLVKQLAKELMYRGLNVEDTKTVIGILDTQEQFEEMLREVVTQHAITKAGALAMAIVITDEIH